MRLFDNGTPELAAQGEGVLAHDPAGDDPMGAFRCDRPVEVLALLRQLRDSGHPVALSSPNGVAMSATLWTLDPDRERLTLDVERNEPQLPALVDSNEVSATAYLDAVKLQFDLHGLLLVRSERATALQAALPRRLYRFQRRNAYRVRTLDRTSPTAQMRHPSIPDMLIALRVVDVSIGGCALQLPTDIPPLPLGTLVHGVQFALDGETHFEAALRLQHVSSVGNSTTVLHLGCEMQAIEPDALRALQRYIDHTQKRRRLLSLD